MNTDLARAYAGLFDPFRLKIAREFVGLRKTELAKRIGVTPAALTQYESGSAKPSAATLVKLSFALGQSVEFFAEDGRRQKLSDHGRAFFRSLRSTRQLERDKAEARAFLASEVVDGLRLRVKFPALNIPENLHIGEGATREAIEKRAEQLRAFWKMAPGPVPNMIRLLEANGVIVTRCSIDCSDVDAFSRWFRPGPMVVLNSDKEALDRLRFNAAHELGHLVLHAEVEPGNRILEEQAHMFAAAFLMPRTLIRQYLPTRLDLAAFGHLKQVWGVSVSALIRRARDLGCMSEATYRRAMITLSQLGERTNEKSFPLPGHENAVLLGKAVDVLAAQGYSTKDLARDTRLQESFILETVRDISDMRPLISL
jgi:Zn-dependent peptidase ImmA (M78 family)/DNA-binding XRE family transcriptional regulator